jgi:hypothetical protein
MATRRQSGAAAPSAVRAILEEFIGRARRAAVLEPGLAPLELAEGRFVLHESGGALRLEVWDEQRQWSRLIRRAETAKGGLELEAERFPARTVRLTVVDLESPKAEAPLRRSGRETAREQLRRMARRQYPGWKLHEISAAPDLEHSLSGGFPRALIRRGQEGVAALLGGMEADATLTAALLWLDYLRERETELRVGGMALFIPAAALGATCLLLKALDARMARFSVFALDAGGETQVDPRDYGNLASELPRAAAEAEIPEWLKPLRRYEGVEAHGSGDAVSFRIRGLEFARWDGAALWCGVEKRQRAHGLDEAAAWAERVAQIRREGSESKQHAWYRRAPEAWLESVVRGGVDALDAGLEIRPVYGQVEAREGLGTGVIDLLARQRDGRLVVIELKASEDARLPMQALEYWVRMTRHAEAGSFAPAGYFAGERLRSEAPRLVLAAPALAFHPSTERLLRYFDPRVEVERVGLGLEWRRVLRVVFRVRGAARPEWSGEPA